MNLQLLYDEIEQRQKEAKVEYEQKQPFVDNARTDGADHKELPEFADCWRLRGRWRAFTEIKQMLAILLDPTIDEKRKEEKIKADVPSHI